MFSGIGVIKANAIEPTVNQKMGSLALVSMSKNMHLGSGTSMVFSIDDFINWAF